MTIRTPEDIEDANKIMDNLKEEIKKIEKDINRAKKNFEHIKLDHDITEAVHKVFTNEGQDAYTEIDILDGQYSFSLSKDGNLFDRRSQRITVVTFAKNDGKFLRILSSDVINTDYGLPLITHIVSSIIFKRTAMLRKELKKLESQDTAKHEPKEVNGDGDSETAC